MNSGLIPYMLKALQDDGLLLSEMESQTYNMCLTAVRQNGHALQYVKKQDAKLCLEAVKQTPEALRHVSPDLFSIVFRAFIEEL